MMSCQRAFNTFHSDLSKEGQHEKQSRQNHHIPINLIEMKAPSWLKKNVMAYFFSILSLNCSTASKRDGRVLLMCPTAFGNQQLQ